MLKLEVKTGQFLVVSRKGMKLRSFFVYWERFNPFFSLRAPVLVSWVHPNTLWTHHYIFRTGLPTLIFPGLVGFEILGLAGMGVPGLEGLGVPGLAGLGVPGLKGLGVPGLVGLGVPGLEGLGVPGLAGLAVPGLGRLTLPGLTGKTGLSPSSNLMTGWDNRWAFGSTDGTSKSTPLTTALL